VSDARSAFVQYVGTHTHTHETIKRSCKRSLVRISPIAVPRSAVLIRGPCWPRRSLVHLLRARAANLHLHWTPMPNLHFHTHVAIRERFTFRLIVRTLIYLQHRRLQKSDIES